MCSYYKPDYLLPSCLYGPLFSTACTVHGIQYDATYSSVPVLVSGDRGVSNSSRPTTGWRWVKLDGYSTTPASFQASATPSDEICLSDVQCNCGTFPFRTISSFVCRWQMTSVKLVRILYLLPGRKSEQQAPDLLLIFGYLWSVLIINT